MGCNSNPSATQKAAAICAGSIAVTALVLFATASGAPEAADAESQGSSQGVVLGLVPNCIEFAYDLLSLSPSNPQALVMSAFSPADPNTNADGSSHVAFSAKYSLNGVASGKVYDMILGNCTPSIGSVGIPTLKFQLSFSFSIPFSMSVGPRGNSSTFRSKPTGNSNSDLVGRAVFDQYHLNGVISSVKQTINLEIAPHKKMTLSLLMTVPYIYGIARLDQNNSTSYVPWMFTNTKQTGQFKLGTQNC